MVEPVEVSAARRWLEGCRVTCEGGEMVEIHCMQVGGDTGYGELAEEMAAVATHTVGGVVVVDAWGG